MYCVKGIRQRLNKKSTRSIAFPLTLIFLMFFSGQAESISPSKKYIGDMVLESDLIMVGKVVEVLPFEKQGQMYARVISISQIKGSGDANFIYKTGISELDPDCCVVGKTYLLFLRRQPDGYFVSVGGRQGVIPSTKNAKNGVRDN